MFSVASKFDRSVKVEIEQAVGVVSWASTFDYGVEGGVGDIIVLNKLVDVSVALEDEFYFVGL